MHESMHLTGEASVRARVRSLPAVLDSAAVESCPGTNIDTRDDYIKGAWSSWSVLTQKQIIYHWGGNTL